MNIRCPNCQTVFRVDPARVPPAGIRARCARCGATFAVTRDAVSADAGSRGAASTSAAPPAQGAGAPAAGGAATPQPPAPSQAGPGASGGGAAGAAAAGGPARGAQAPQRPATPQVGSPGGATAVGRVPVFGSRDPGARAQRIARALVSDIVAYHPKRRDESLNAGTLRADFREEIMKSWEEYVAQVGLELAKSTPHFRNALNDILAKGQAIF